MSSGSGPEDRKEPILGSETPGESEPVTETPEPTPTPAPAPTEAEAEAEDAPEADPAETLANTEPDRLPPWLGMPDEEVKVSRFSPGMIAAGVAGLIIFGAIVWVVYHQAGERGSTPPPVITADNAPTKVQPESPGGADIPNQDKTVYDRVNPEAPTEPESILPPPEEPQGLEPAQTSGEQSTAGQTTTAEQAPPPVKTQEVAPTPAPTPPAQKVAEAPKPAPAPAPAPKPAPVAAAASGSFLVQLGAFGDDAGANRAWKTLSGKYPSQLGDLQSDIQTVDLGAKGVFHRLRAGPFSSRDAAETVCEELKAQKQGCLVVAR